MVVEIASGRLHFEARASLRMAGRPDHLSDGDDDLAGWRRDRLPTDPDTPATNLAPDRTREIPSPSTRRLDLTARRDLSRAKAVPTPTSSTPKPERRHASP